MAHTRRVDRLTLVALFLAVVGGGAAYAALRTPAADGASEERQPLVVAVQSIAVGERITARGVRVDTLPAGSLPRGAVVSVEAAAGKYAALPIVAGEPLLAAKLSDVPPGSGLAALVPPDRLAVSIAVNDVISTGGLLAPGDRVDVLGVVSKDAVSSAEVVLRDIPVLAVAGMLLGGEAEKSRGKASAENPRSLNATVTLAVTIDEARRLVQMDEIGKIRLALRGRTPSNQ